MFELTEIAKVTGARLVKKAKQKLLKGVSSDSRTIKKGEIFFALRGDNFDGQSFVKDAVSKGAAAVVVSKMVKGIDRRVNILKVSNPTLALGRLAKAYRRRHDIPLIAITGSTGKTTTKDLAYDVLSTEYRALKNFGTHNNQIGVPQTIFKLNRKHQACVLELGSNHFGEIAYLSRIASPQIAVITNIGASHLEFLNDLKGVLKEKKSVLSYLKKPKIVLLNGDDEFLRRIRLPRDFKVFFFGQGADCDFRASGITIKNNKTNFVLNKKHSLCLNSLGRFNIYNALAGIGAGLIMGVSIRNIKKALQDFQFPKKRLERIDCHNFSIIDDTYNSNPLSLTKAIESLSECKVRGRRILVMGDMLELGKRSLEFHRQIGVFVCKNKVDMLVTLGRLSKATGQVVMLKSTGSRSVFTFDTKPELISFLKNIVKPGDLLLIKGSRLLGMEDITNSLIGSHSHAL